VVGQNLYFCAMNFTGTLVLGFDAVGCVSGLLSCYIKCQHFFGHSETILIIIGDFVKKIVGWMPFLMLACGISLLHSLLAFQKAVVKLYKYVTVHNCDYTLRGSFVVRHC